MRAVRNNTSRMTSLAVRVCVVVPLLAGAAQAVDWTEWGPAPIASVNHTGRVSALAVSQLNPDVMWAAGADGGVWRTRDGGITWTPLTDQMPTLSIGALALDPKDENILYAGSGEANFANHSRYGLGLYKSTNGGDTWTVLAADVFAGRCFAKILINPQNTQQVFAAITRAGGFPALAAAKGHPNADGPVGVFRSEDGGATWTHLTSGLPNLCATDLTMDPSSPNVLYAGIGRIFGAVENGIYKTTDGGDSWNKLGGGLPTSGVGRVSVAVAPSLPSRLYAMITKQADPFGGGAEMLGAYRSNDGGTSWTQLTALFNPQATYGWYLSVVSVNPTVPDRVYMGGVTLHLSNTGGSSFSDITPPHVDMHALAWSAGGVRLICGNDGGVHRSTTGGSSWGARNFGLGVIQCYAGLSTHPTDNDIAFAGLQDNGTIRRDASGSWYPVIGGDGGWTQLNQTEPNYVYGEFQGTGNFYRSTNGGLGFNYAGIGINVGDRNCFLPPHLVDPKTAGRMIYGTHRVYESTDYGLSWTPISGDLTGGGVAAIRSLAIAPSDSNIVYAATNDGRMLRSDDAGKNFALLLTNVPGWPRITREFFVHPSKPLTVYLAVGRFNETQIRRSTDGGQNWQPLDASFPDLPVNVASVDVRGRLPIIFAGTDAGVYRSINGGRSWHRYGNGLPNACVIDVQVQAPRSRLMAATQGRGVWKTALGLPGDLNGDAAVDNFDIDAFVLALTNPAGYAQKYPNIDPILVGDMNGDGKLNNFDIDGFVELISAP